MSAVYVPAGDNTIVFEYRTPYLNTGIAVTAAGWVIYAGYIYIMKKKNNNV